MPPLHLNIVAPMEVMEVFYFENFGGSDADLEEQR